jgi:hypothetical protein
VIDDKVDVVEVEGAQEAPNTLDRSCRRLPFKNLEFIMFSMSVCDLHFISDSCLVADRLCQPPTRYAAAALNILGQIRTATKRAGGTIKNHGGTAGRRLGVKKFSGQLYTNNDSTVHRKN